MCRANFRCPCWDESYYLGFFGVFFGEPEHFVELIFAAKIFIIHRSQFGDQLIQFVPLFSVISVPGISG